MGQQVRSETQWYTVVGVASKDFDGLALPRSTSIWIPLHVWTRQHPELQARLEDRDSLFVTVLARLSPAVSDSEATAQLRVIQTQLDRETVRRNVIQDPIATEPVRGVTGRGDRSVVQRVMDLLFTVAGVLLLICCVNVGNLLLVRLLVKLIPALPLGEMFNPNVPLDWRVIAFIISSALATVFIFGLIPAWKASSMNLAGKIRSSLGTVQGVRLRKGSAVAQVALSSCSWWQPLYS